MRSKTEVTLLVNGVEYTGWKSAQIVSSIEQIATQFAVEVTRKYPSGEKRIEAGDAVVVKVGDATICSGFVDATPVSYNATSITVSITGRSKTADIVDCAIDTAIGQPSGESAATSWQSVTTRADGTKIEQAPAASEWNGVDIKKTISRLCARYGVKVYDQTHKNYVSKKVSVSKGTAVYQAINDLIKEFNLFVTDTETGDLLLSESKRLGTAYDAIVARLNGEGTNVLEGSCDNDYSSVYTQYEVFGQARPQDADEPTAFYNVSAKTSGGGLTRDRVLRIFLDGDQTIENCRERADFEKTTRLAEARSLTYKLQGWHQSNGDLWRKGLTVRVVDEFLNVDGEYLIESVTYSQSESGTFVELSLVPIEGIK